MSSPAKEFGEKVRDERLARKWSQQFLADRAGTTQSTVDRIERGVSDFSRKMPAVAKALGLDSHLPPIPASMPTSETAPPAVSSPRTMPLFSMVDHASGGLAVGAEPIGQVARPAHLADAAGAYAVYIADSTMVPEFEIGDTAEIDPRLPPVPGATCIFYTTAETGSATIRRLERANRTGWEVRQWNPPEGDPAEETLPREEWPTCHRIVGRIVRR